MGDSLQQKHEKLENMMDPPSGSFMGPTDLCVLQRLSHPLCFVGLHTQSSWQLGVQCLWGCQATNRLQLKIIFYFFTLVFHKRFNQEFWGVCGLLKGTILSLHWVTLPELILDTLRDFYEKESEMASLLHFFKIRSEILENTDTKSKKYTECV